MRKLKRWIPLLGTMLLCGCFQVQDELTVHSDGSGTVRLTVRSSLPEEMIGMMTMSSRMGGGPSAPMYPPVDEREAKHFFPAKDFVLKVEQSATNEARTVVIEAAFKDINALLASPYGQAHQLSLVTNAGGQLKFRALGGGSIAAQAAQFKAEGEMSAVAAMPGMEDMILPKNWTSGLDGA